MLRLEIENLLSFKHRVKIDLTVPAKAGDGQGRYVQVGTERIPKTIAFYGANAAGKSNVLRVFAQLCWFLRDSFSWQGGAMPFRSFLASDCADRPSFIAVEYFSSLPPGTSYPENSETRFRYELSLCRSPENERMLVVQEEVLSVEVPDSGRMNRVFRRDLEGEISGSMLFPVPKELRKLRARANCAAIAHLAQFNHPQARHFLSLAQSVQSNIVFGRYSPDDQTVFRQYQSAPGLLDQLVQRVSMLDIGLERIEFLPGVSGLYLAFHHKGLTEHLAFQDESHGTQEFVRMFPWLIGALATGGMAVIDELDQALHPKLAAEIVRWFQSPESNPKNAILWFTSQTTDLMDMLEKEEIFLCEKGTDGNTAVTGLKNFQGVRRGGNFRRMYLDGSFGAIPRLG